MKEVHQFLTSFVLAVQKRFCGWIRAFLEDPQHGTKKPWRLSHRYSYQAMDITTSNEVYFWSGIHITAGFDKQFHYLIVSTASSNTECKLWKQNCSDKNNHVKDWSQMTIRRYTIIICGIFWNFKSLFLSLIIPKYQLLLIPILWNTNSYVSQFYEIPTPENYFARTIIDQIITWSSHKV